MKASRVLVLSLYHDFVPNSNKLAIMRVQTVVLDQLRDGERQLRVSESSVTALENAVARGNVVLTNGKFERNPETGLNELKLVGSDDRYRQYGYLRTSPINTVRHSKAITRDTIYYVLACKLTKQRAYVFVDTMGRISILDLETIYRLYYDKKAFVSNAVVTRSKIRLIDGTIPECDLPLGCLDDMCHVYDGCNTGKDMQNFLTQGLMVDRVIETMRKYNLETWYSFGYLFTLTYNTLRINGRNTGGQVKERVYIGNRNNDLSYRVVLNNFKCEHLGLEILPNADHRVVICNAEIGIVKTDEARMRAGFGSLDINVLKSDVAKAQFTDITIDSCVTDSYLSVHNADRVNLAASCIGSSIYLTGVKQVEFKESAYQDRKYLMSIANSVSLCDMSGRGKYCTSVVADVKTTRLAVRCELDVAARCNGDVMLNCVARDFKLKRFKIEPFCGNIVYDAERGIERLKHQLELLKQRNGQTILEVHMMKATEEILKDYEKFGTRVKLRTGAESVIDAANIKCDKLYTESNIKNTTGIKEVINEYR